LFFGGNLKKIWINIFILAVLGFIVYANSMSGEFVWDDEGLVKNNLHIRSLAGLPKLFKESIYKGSGLETMFYRPLQMITYAVDYASWGLDPAGYHLTNIFLHILTGLALCRFIFLLYADGKLAFLTAALFLVHPIHTEAVSYIASRADILAALFTLLCVSASIRQLSLKSPWGYFCVGAAFLGAILSKEQSLIIPVLLCLHSYVFKKRLQLKELGLFAGIILLYAAARVMWAGGLGFAGASSSHLWQRLPGFFIAISGYFKLLFLPFPLHMAYGEGLYSFWDSRALVGVMITSVLLIYALRKKGPADILSWGILWFFVTLLPSANLFPINAFMAEHWLYLPSMGFFLILSRGLLYLSEIKKLKHFYAPLTVFLLIFFSILTMRQNTVWRDAVNFYRYTLQYNSRDAKLLNSLGNSYYERARYADAVASYRKALLFAPRKAGIYVNIGDAWAALGDKKEALAAYKQAIAEDARYAGAYLNLGYMLVRSGQEESAEFFYKKAIEVNRGFLQAYLNLGDLYLKQGRTAEAIAAYEGALFVFPGWDRAHARLVVAYLRQGKDDLAAAHCAQALDACRKMKLRGI
jgi:tetratricopeptide (TPR) repeat protein